MPENNQGCKLNNKSESLSHKYDKLKTTFSILEYYLRIIMRSKKLSVILSYYILQFIAEIFYINTDCIRFALNFMHVLQLIEVERLVSYFQMDSFHNSTTIFVSSDSVNNV